MLKQEKIEKERQEKERNEYLQEIKWIETLKQKENEARQ